MNDLRAIYVRDTVPVRDARLVVVLRVEKPPGEVEEGHVDGVLTPFIITGDSVLLVRPQQVQKLAGWSVKVVTVVDGLRYTVNYSSTEVVTTAPAFFLTVENAKSVSKVLVNKSEVGHAVLSSTSLVCEVPKKDNELRSIDVITTVPTMTRTSFFDFVLPIEASLVTGKQKTIMQFMKLLLTTPGTNILDQSSGGGLRNLAKKPVVGTDVSQVAPDLFMAVARTTAQMLAGQAGTKVPNSEKLAVAQVLGITQDPSDRASYAVSLRFVTLDQVQIDVSMSLSNNAGQ